MTENNQKKFKIYFSVIVLIMIAVISGGSFLIKNNSYFNKNYMLMNFNYLKYKINFAQTQKKDLAAIILTFISQTFTPQDDLTLKYSNDRTKSIPVLVYHGIVNKPDGFNVLLRDFKDQMFALKKAGWQTISIKDLYAFMKGEKKLPDKPFLLTFDDGRKDSFYPVDPILKVLDYNAVIFVITKHLLEDKSDYYLSKNELQQMNKSGRWDIQAHGYQFHNFIEIDDQGNKGHFASNKMWLSDQGRIETDEEYKQRLLDDHLKSKNLLESHIKGLKVIAFAFPFGDYGQDALNIDKNKAIESNLAAVREVYPLSFELNNQNGDFINHKYSECNLLKRFEVPNDLSASNLIKILEGSRTKKLPYFSSKFNSDNIYDWFYNWGSLYTNNNNLILKAKKDSSGAMAILNGGYYWQNYSVETKFSIKSGRTGFLIGRYVNDDNYVFCGLDDDSILLKEKVSGKYITLKSVKYKKENRDYKVKLNFIGDTAICEVDDRIFLGPVAIEHSLNRGSVGFKIWDPQDGLAKMSVQKVKIKNNFANFIYYAYLNNNNHYSFLVKYKEDIDIISPTWFRLTRTGDVVGEGWSKDIIMRIANKNNIVVLPMISNWSPILRRPDSQIIHSIISNELVKQKAIKNIVATIENYGLKGINIDIENVPPQDKELFNKFISDLSKNLHKNHYILSIALSAKTSDIEKINWSKGLDYENIGKHSDLIVIMAYDNHHLNNSPGPVAPYRWVDNVLQYATSKIKNNKLFLGIAGYGYDWIQENNKYKGYKSLPANLSFNVSNELRKSYQKAKVDNFNSKDGFNFTYTDDKGENHIVWIENTESAKYKFNLAKKYNLGGIALWSLGRESLTFWDIIKEKE